MEVDSTATETAAPVNATIGPEQVEETDTVIIGGGPAGLATSACLRRAGVPFLMLERSDRVGSAWHQRYDRLHLHTAKQHSALPYMRFPKDCPRFPSRLQVIEYLEGYARRFELRARFGEEVTSVRREGNRWETFTHTRRYASNRVVVATGYNGMSHLPSWPGQDAFKGAILHSSRYRNGRPFHGQRVLIIGMGNTGAEIAIDLCEHGAEVCISIRRPVNVIPRDFLGMAFQMTRIALSWLPTNVEDRIGRAVSLWAFGDLSRFGLPFPVYGPATQVERYCRVPVIDVGTIDLIKRHAISVVPGVNRLTQDGVVFVNGTERAFDAVILATGYDTGLDQLLEDCELVCDQKCIPLWLARETSLRGLYFVGFSNPYNGILREISFEAKRVARHIHAKYLGMRQPR